VSVLYLVYIRRMQLILRSLTKSPNALPPWPLPTKVS